MRQFSLRIQQTLDGTAIRWKFLRVVHVSCELGCLLCLLVLALGLAAWMHWLSSMTVYGIAIAVAIVATGLTWFIRCIMAMDRELEPGFLAASVESARPILMDRLNTLVELQDRPLDPAARTFGDAIEQQTRALLARTQTRSTFSWKPTLTRSALLLCLMVSTIWFYVACRPLQQLQAGTQPAATEPDQQPDPLEIPPPPDEPLQEPFEQIAQGPWGEIRISDPGENRRITVAEDLPLLIEAAANRPLAEVTWISLKNNANPQVHLLPASEDPRYAVHRPIIDPQRLGLEVWDLLAYRATALAEDGARYESETYFVEIIPSRPQLDELPDEAIETLENLTDLIEQQQQTLREIEELEDQDEADSQRKSEALAAEEEQLAKQTQQLADAIEQADEFGRLEPSTAALRDANNQLQMAAEHLQEDQPQAAREQADLALQELARSRRELGQLLQRQPKALQDLPRQQPSEPTPPLTENAGNQQPSLQPNQQERQPDGRRETETPHNPASAPETSSRPSDASASTNAPTLNEQLQRNIDEYARIERTPESLTADQAQDTTDRTLHLLEQLKQVAELLDANRFQQQGPPPPPLPEPATNDPSQLANSQDPSQRPESSARRPEQSGSDASAASPPQPNETDSPTPQATTPQATTPQQTTPEQSTPEPASTDDASLDTPQALPPADPKAAPEPDPTSAASPSREPAPREANPDEANPREPQPADDQAESGKPQSDQPESENNQTEDTSPQPAREPQPPVPPRLSQRLTPELEQQIRKQCNGLCQNPGAAGTGAAAAGLKQSLESLAQALQQDVGQQNLGQQNIGQQVAGAQPSPAGSEGADTRPPGLDGPAEGLPGIGRSLTDLMNRLSEMQRSPADASPGQRQQLADHSQQAGQDLRQQSDRMASTQPTGSAEPSAQGLGEATSDERLAELNQRADQLRDAQTPGQTGQAAEQLLKSLEQLSKALQGISGMPGMSGPSLGESLTTQTGQQQSTSLRPSGADAVERALQQLESAVRQSGTSPPGEASSAQSPAARSIRNVTRETTLRDEALVNLESGVNSQYGYNERSIAVLQRWRKELGEQSQPVSAELLRELREDIQKLQYDVALDAARREPEGPTTRIDASRFAPEYREAIRRYFESLSEQP